MLINVDYAKMQFKDATNAYLILKFNALYVNMDSIQLLIIFSVLLVQIHGNIMMEFIVKIVQINSHSAMNVFSGIIHLTA